MSSSFLKNIGAPGIKSAPPKAKGKNAFEEAISSKVQPVAAPMSVYDLQQAAPGSGSIDRWNSRWTPNGFQVPGTSPDRYDGRGLTDVYGRGIYGEKGTAQSPKSAPAPESSSSDEAPSKPESQKPGATTGGRNDTRVIPGSGGATQTGTKMGVGSMPGLDDLDMSGIANFAGPSFPTQPATNRISDGYANTSGQQLQGVTESERQQLSDAGFITAGELDGFKPGGKFAGAPTATEGLGPGSATIANGPNAGKTVNVNDKDYEAVRDGTKKVSGSSGGGLKAALADQSGMRFSMEKYKGNIVEGKEFDSFGGANPMSYATSPTEMRRRSAFLDASDSMSGLRAVDAGFGIKYAGGQHIANVNGKPVVMDSDGEFSARNIKNQAPGEAQALKDKWVKALSSKKEDEPQVASSAQNPTEQSGTSTFVTDPKQKLPGVAESIDYSNNNQENNVDIKIDSDVTKVRPENFTNPPMKLGTFSPTQFYLK